MPDVKCAHTDCKHNRRAPNALSGICEMVTRIEIRCGSRGCESFCSRHKESPVIRSTGSGCVGYGCGPIPDYLVRGYDVPLGEF